jgi:hypothetical protein
VTHELAVEIAGWIIAFLVGWFGRGACDAHLSVLAYDQGKHDGHAEAVELCDDLVLQSNARTLLENYRRGRSERPAVEAQPQ